MKSITSLAGYITVVIGGPAYTGKVAANLAAFIAANKDERSMLPVAGFVTGIAPVYPKTGDVKEFTDQLVLTLAPIQNNFSFLQTFHPRYLKYSCFIRLCKFLIPHSRLCLTMDPVLLQIRQDLKSQADPQIRQTSARFFKEEIACYGTKTAAVTAIAKKYWNEVKGRPKVEIFSLCENLYQSGYLEESFIVSNWTHALTVRYEQEDFVVFRYWIDTYITNWAACDSFCNHTMGDFIEKFPEYIGELKRWTQSDNRWMRRAAAVSLIVPAKQGKYIDDVLEIADLLLTDKDDMVLKGYGWLLKEASRKHLIEVFDYVMRNRKSMPRTALRYAIELMPKELKADAMMKDWKGQKN
jgi:3-methyladenine DNA glycosylase AlkD